MKIDLIVRGICCLKPGIEGVSDNIRVISLIGKYLEHARIFYFKNAPVSIFISSADWMPRNLVRRIELLTAVEDKQSSEKLLQILHLQCSDNVLSYQLLRDGNYKKIETDPANIVNSQKLMENHVNRVHKSIKKESSSYVARLVNRLVKE